MKSSKITFFVLVCQDRDNCENKMSDGCMCGLYKKRPTSPKSRKVTAPKLFLCNEINVLNFCTILLRLHAMCEKLLNMIYHAKGQNNYHVK